MLCMKLIFVATLVEGFWFLSNMFDLAKIRETVKFEKRPLSVKNSSPGSKADFSEKFLFCIRSLILSRYHIKCHMYCIILNICQQLEESRSHYEVD